MIVSIIATTARVERKCDGAYHAIDTGSPRLIQVGEVYFRAFGYAHEQKPHRLHLCRTCVVFWRSGVPDGDPDARKIDDALGVRKDQTLDDLGGRPS